KLESLGIAHRAIECHPSHDLGEGKVAATAPHFPDSFIRLLPDLLEMLDQLLLQRPPRPDGSKAKRSSLIQGVNQLAGDVELKLTGGRVSNAHWRSAAVARQPWHLPLDELSFARYPIHDLELMRASRHTAPEPLRPRPRLIAVACRYKRHQ